MNSNMSGSGDQVQRVTKEEVDVSGGEPVRMSPPENKQKTKRYQRHTPLQIKAMEEDCPHPDNKQRTELSQDIGIEPLQVKFWFQNKRTQMKTKHERQQNTNLRAEKEKLRAENMRLTEALSNATCPACGCMASIGDVTLDDRHLRMENARLRDEVMHYSHKLFLIFVYIQIYITFIFFFLSTY
ncbi:homeobox-leucine zipper protein roc7 [Phtheirospermum japonicum]|uniref:Homeobox-leucine zipper protein roc7 n=1 Tax=Phtheirospermum japonicum TaxID=374723 RepID=A0A830B4R7_9LAMI|nr:homeobox-leucine zipper protein roc7 [Phtheirospermum japonicum]